MYILNFKIKNKNFNLKYVFFYTYIYNKEIKNKNFYCVRKNYFFQILSLFFKKKQKNKFYQNIVNKSSFYFKIKSVILKKTNLCYIKINIFFKKANLIIIFYKIFKINLLSLIIFKYSISFFYKKSFFLQI